MNYFKNSVVNIYFFIFIFWLSFLSELLPLSKNIYFFYFSWGVFLWGILTHKDVRRKVYGKENILFWVYLSGIAISSWKVNFLYGSGIYRDTTFVKFVSFIIPTYFLARYFLTPEILKKLVLFWILCGIIVVLIGIGEFFFHENLIYKRFIYNFFYERFISTHRMMATFIHPNILGAYLITLLPLTFYYKKDRWLFYSSFSVIITGIILSFSRGTWMAGILITFIYLIAKKKIKIVVLLVVFILIFTTFLQFLSSESLLSWELKRRLGIINLVNYILKGHRTYRYWIGWKMFLDYPFSGVGWGCFRTMIDNYASPGVLSHEIKIPDSVYLMHLAESGIIGFLPFIGLIFSTLKKQKDKLSPVAFSFYGLGFNFFTFDGFLWTSTLLLFWFLLGILNTDIQI